MSQPMRHYPVSCTSADCARPAVYKVAAVWNDGLTQELKTYFLSCESCLAGHFKLALERHKTCRVAEGETISPPEIHERVATDSGTQLRRRPDLEAVPTRR